MLNSPEILLVEDDPHLRQTLAAWLTAAGYQVTEAEHGVEALARLRTASYDVAITDLKMPHLSGLQLLGLLKSHQPDLPVIFLSGQATMDDAIAALREHQAFDFLQKPLQDLSRLNLAIERALLRRTATVPPAPPASPLPSLTYKARERELLELLIEGQENREIAARLMLSEKTVRNQLSELYEKLGVTNRTQAALRYQQQRSL